MSETGTEPGTRQLKISTKLAYGAGAAAEAPVGLIFNTFAFFFYNNVLGLSGTLAGLAVTIAIAFDAVSDPVIGSISDRWKSRLGRRHPFLYLSALPLGFCFLAIFSPPDGLSQVALFLWFTTFTVGLRLSLTFYHVPHLALGAELTDDYRERSVVYAYNSIFGMIGGSTAYFFIWTYLGIAEGGQNEASNFLVIGLSIGLLGAVVILISAFYTRDQIPFLKKIADDLPPFSVKRLLDDIWACFQNRNYIWLLLGLLSISATSGIREAFGTYVNLYFWELVPNQIRYFALATPLAFLLAFIITPKLNDRFDKSRTMSGGIVVLIITATAPVTLRLFDLLPENGHVDLFPILMGFVAVYYGALAVLNISVMSALADVADEHEIKTGRRQEGIFYSARTFVGKAASAFGLLIGGIAIDLIGWPTGVTSADQVSSDIIFKLGLVDGPLAAIPSLFAIYFYSSYNISKERYLEIQATLIQRRQDTVE